MDFPPRLIPLFVYGSLRPGMALWPEIRDAVTGTRPASVAGRLHWHAGMEWPLLLLPDGDAAHPRVHGEILLLAPGARANRVIVDEELLYGYEARWLTASVDDVVSGAHDPGPGPEGTEVLALVWNRGDAVGPAIPHGDYTRAVAGR